MFIYIRNRFSLKFNQTEYSGSYIILYLRTCTNTTENNNHCYPQEEIENFMKNGSYYFAYLMESIKVDHYNNSNPFSPFIGFPVFQFLLSVLLFKIRPRHIGKIKFAICQLPQQVIRQPQFSAGTDHQIRIRDPGRIQII